MTKILALALTAFALVLVALETGVAQADPYDAGAAIEHHSTAPSIGTKPNSSDR